MKRIMITLIAIILLVAIVSCAQPKGVTSSVPAPMPAPAPASMPPEFRGESSYSDKSLPGIGEERMIIRSGDMSLVVKDVTGARNEIAQMAEKYDGYVVSSRIWGDPHKRFSSAISLIKAIVSGVIRGRRVWPCDLRRPNNRKPCLCHWINVSGSTTCNAPFNHAPCSPKRPISGDPAA